MITLTATTMAGVTATCSAGAPLLALKLSSGLLFSAVTGMLLVMNKIQPSLLHITFLPWFLALQPSVTTVPSSTITMMRIHSPPAHSLSPMLP